MPARAEVERRALQVLEALSEATDAERPELLAREPPEVRRRLAALEASLGAGDLGLATGPVSRTPELERPERIGPYRIDEPIGQGGMGSVWLARRDDGVFDQAIAVKFIHTELDSQAIARFEAERRLLARLEHPNIARILDGGLASSGLPYLTMEYVEGRPIDAATAGRDIAGTVAAFMQAAEAVQFAHGKLVVHADLKPSNILVDASGRVRLLDFGIARLVDDDDAVGPTPMTHDYASPQRRAGGRASIADDVFALGMILEDLTGAVGDRDLDAIAAKAAAPDEAARYGSVAELLGDLTRWRERLPVRARPQTVGYRAERFLARHRLGVALTVAAMLVLAASTAVATVSYIRAEQARAEAEARFDDARGTARYLLYDVADALDRTPGTLPLRTKVAAVSQRYLDRLSTTPHATPAVRLESVDGLLRLATRQASSDAANLGQAEAARRSYDRALRVLRGLNGPIVERQRARALVGAARLESNAFNDFARAERFLAEARPLVDGARAPAADLFGEYANALSELRQWQARYPEAQAAAEAAEAAPATRNAYADALRRELAAGMAGDAIFYQGDVVGALVPYRRSLAMAEASLVRWPDDPTLRRRLARARYNVASTLLEAGRLDEALAASVRASAISGALAAAEPTDAVAQRMFTINENVRALTLGKLGRTDEAVAILSASAARRLALWRATPGDIHLARDYATSIAMTGDVEVEAGRKASGCRRYAEAETVFADLGRKGQISDQDRDFMLKLLQRNRAKHCR